MQNQGDASAEALVLPADLRAISDDQLLSRTRVISSTIDAAEHVRLTLIREIDRRCLYVEYRLPSTVPLLSWLLGMSAVTAREHLRVALALAQLPLIDEALRKAQVSYSKVRAMTRVATSDNEGELLEMARHATAAQLERICRLGRAAQRAAVDGEPVVDEGERWLVFESAGNGLVRMTAMLLPDEAAVVDKALQDVRRRAIEEPAAAVENASAEAAEGQSAGALAEARDGGSADASAEPPDPLALSLQCARKRAAVRRALVPNPADALLAIAESYLAAGPHTRRAADRHTVQVHLQPDLLGAGSLGATLEDGTRLHPETLRRIACDCRIGARLLDGERILDRGRTKRLITDALRCRMLERDGAECVFAGCRRKHALHGHHVRSWLDGGETNEANLAMLCSQHHRAVHECGYRIEVVSAGVFRFFDPRGRELSVAPKPIAVADPIGALARAQATAGVHVTDETGRQLTYTPRVDYAACATALS